MSSSIYSRDIQLGCFDLQDKIHVNVDGDVLSIGVEDSSGKDEHKVNHFSDQLIGSDLGSSS